MSAFEKLSDRRKVFVTEYISDFNASRAAREAGYSLPDKQGAVIKDDPLVKKAIAECLEPMLAENRLTADSILQQLSNFLFCNVFRFVDEDGYLDRPLKDLPDFVQQCITGYTVEPERYTKDGELLTGKRIKVTLVDKVACLNLAMKYRNLLNPESVTNIGVFGSQEDVRRFWQDFNSRSRGGEVEHDTVEAEIDRLTNSHGKTEANPEPEESQKYKEAEGEAGQVVGKQGEGGGAGGRPDASGAGL